MRTIGAAYGTDLSASNVRQIKLRIQREGRGTTSKTASQLSGRPPNSLPNSKRGILERTRTATRCQGQRMADEFPLFRGFLSSLMYNGEWAPVDYWFVNPAARIGRHVNYGQRIRGGTALVLPTGSIVFDARRNRDLPLVDRETYDALRNIVMKEAR